MQYISTRGAAAEKTFADILFEGYAADGGLYVPKEYPKVSLAELAQWRGLDYAGFAWRTFSLFWPELDSNKLWSLCRDCFQPNHYPFGRDRFKHEVAPTTWLHDGVGIMELANGPTLTFDDHSMRFLMLANERELAGPQTERVLLGATTGDMGASCEHFFADKPGVKVVMLAPKGRMTRFQEAQLYSCLAENVLNIEVDGTFDDCQDIVTALLTDEDFRKANRLNAVNTVLWARIATQVVCYFYAYVNAVEKLGEDVVFTVPAGNFGNAFAGWVAKKMGLPIMRIIIATNENDAMDRFMRTGTYAPRPSSETVLTSSPSMDISRAANFERFLFEVLDRRADRVAALMAQLREEGSFTLEPEEFAKVRRSVFTSGTSTHADRLEIMESMHVEYHALVDPHTADCLYSGIYLHPVGVRTICFETVQPLKSRRIVEESTGVRMEAPEAFRGLADRAQKRTASPADKAAAAALIEAFAQGKAV